MVSTKEANPLTDGPRPASPIPTLRVGAVAAAGALLALMVGGTIAGMTEQILRTHSGWQPLVDHSGLFIAGAVALALISAFDAFTVPALHRTLTPFGPAMALAAAGTALLGDCVGVIARLIQAAEVPAATAGHDPALLVAVEETLNVGGFLIVSLSFGCFCLLMWRAGARVLGITAGVAAVTTAVGQFIPPVFYVASATYVVWYAGLMIRFHRLMRP